MIILFSFFVVSLSVFSLSLGQLQVDGHSLEFFIEGTRSRSGKMLHPKTGMLSVVTNVLLGTSAMISKPVERFGVNIMA